MSNGAGPTTLHEWTQYLHAAAQVKPDSPDYREAREAIGHALLHINALHVGESMAEATQDEQVGALPAAVASLAHGASLGTGEPLAGLGSALSGGTFTEGAQQYREGLGNIEASNPVLAPAAELVGGAALPAARVGQGLYQGVKAGIPLGLAGGAKLIGQGAAGAAVPGAIAGFSAGGKDPGDFYARLIAGGKSGALAALLGGLTTAGGIEAVRGHVERAADIANKGVTRKLQAQRLRNAEAVGMRMGKKDLPTHVAGDALSDITQAAQDLHTGKISQEDFDTAMDVAGSSMRSPARAGPASATRAQPISAGPPGTGAAGQATALRPGEAAAPIPGTAGRGIAVTGARITPPEGTAQPTLAEMTGTAQLGATADKIAAQRGTLPYYPRGGKAEQARAPRPVSSGRLPDMAIRLENPTMLADFPVDVIRNRLANTSFRNSLRPSQVATVEEFLAQVTQ